MIGAAVAVGDHIGRITRRAFINQNRVTAFANDIVYNEMGCVAQRGMPPSVSPIFTAALTDWSVEVSITPSRITSWIFTLGY